MNRRTFVKTLVLGSAGLVPVLLAGGCVAPRISPTVWEPANGQPWRCQNCGHLERSNRDLSQTRCPRCYHRTLKQITEEEMAERLKDPSVKRPEKI